MKVLIDTCVLYPTVMREMVLGVAATGAFDPLWSPRILEEWIRAAQKLGAIGQEQARSDAAMIGARFPQALVTPPEALSRRLWLPDPNDIHVLAAAVAGSADAILTLNAKDFPRNLMAEEGLARWDPDSFLHQQWLDDPDTVEPVAKSVLDTARQMSNKDWQMRPLLKKARLPRLAKALSQLS